MRKEKKYKTTPQNNWVKTLWYEGELECLGAQTQVEHEFSCLWMADEWSSMSQLVNIGRCEAKHKDVLDSGSRKRYHIVLKGFAHKCPIYYDSISYGNLGSCQNTNLQQETSNFLVTKS